MPRHQDQILTEDRRDHRLVCSHTPVSQALPLSFIDFYPAVHTNTTEAWKSSGVPASVAGVVLLAL